MGRVCVVVCVPVCLSFEPAGQFVKFERKVNISKLLNFFNFSNNRDLPLQTPENLRKSFLSETSRASASIGFTAHRTSFIIRKCFLLDLDSVED